MKFKYKVDEDGRPRIPTIVQFQASDDHNPNDGDLPFEHAQALIDTGAAGCVISPWIVESIKPVSIGQRTHTSLGSVPRKVDCYTCAVLFGDNDHTAVVQGVEFMVDNLPEGIDIILGMPFMKHATWKFKPDGSFSATMPE